MSGSRRAPVISVVLLFLLGAPVALFASFVLAFASDACGLSGRGTFACSPTMQLVTFTLPVVGLLVGLASGAIAVVVSTRGRDAGYWILAAWLVYGIALLTAIGLASTMGPA